MIFLKLSKILFFIYVFSLKFDFGNSYKTNRNRISTFKHISRKYISINSISLKTPEYFENKIRPFLKLIRANNIPATTFLCFSGGWIMNPSIRLFQNKYFWISTLITNLIMSASMAMNDLFDMEVDRMNSPDRPLITGEVSKKEAIGYTIGMIGLAEVLSIFFLPIRLQWIIHAAVGFTLIYTPILKRMIFVKNLSCATIVAFSLFFTGISSLPNHANHPLFLTESIFQNPRFPILQTAMSLIFCGSFTNEILLDIRDSKGDVKQGIYTIANTFGKIPAFYIAYLTWYITILINTVKMAISRNIVVGGILCTILYPQLVYLERVVTRKISKEAIQNYLKQSNWTMIRLLLYLCVLSYA